MRTQPVHRVKHAAGTVFGAFVIVLVYPGLADASILLKFSQSSYVITRNTSFSVDVVIDGDSNTAALDPVANGLFSYGVKVRLLEPLKVFSTGASAASALNFNGFDPLAQLEAQSDYVALRGNIDLSQMTPYTGTLIGRFNLTDRSIIPGSYVLQLEIHRFTPTDNEFVDGAGTPLDASILPGSTEIQVVEPLNVPVLPPGGLGLMALCFLVLLIRGTLLRRARA